MGKSCQEVRATVAVDVDKVHVAKLGAVRKFSVSAIK